MPTPWPCGGSLQDWETVKVCLLSQRFCRRTPVIAQQSLRVAPAPRPHLYLVPCLFISLLATWPVAPCYGSLGKLAQKYKQTPLQTLEKTRSPGQCGLVGVSPRKLKGHTPKLWVRSPVQAQTRGDTLVFLSLALSLPSPLSKNP